MLVATPAAGLLAAGGVMAGAGGFRRAGVLGALLWAVCSSRAAIICFLMFLSMTPLPAKASALSSVRALSFVASTFTVAADSALPGLPGPPSPELSPLRALGSRANSASPTKFNKKHPC